MQKVVYLEENIGRHVWARRTGECVKPATETPSPETVETVTRRRVIPANQSHEDEKTPDLWEYVRSIGKLDPSAWQKHIIYLYRVEPAPSIPLQKCTSAFFTMPNGQQVPVSDQEEVEFALAQHYGGGVFRIIVKCGAQWVTQARIPINTQPRAITIPLSEAGQSGVSGISGPMTDASATAQVAGRAMDALTAQERQSAEIGFRAMETAANVMQRFSTGGGSQDDLTKQFMAVMMQRMLQPPPDLLELLTKLLAVVNQLSPQGKTDDLVGTVIKAGLDRILNPAPTGAPVSASAELVRQLPQIGSQVAESLREFRMAREAEARIVAMQRTGVVAAQPQPARPAPQMIPPAQPAPSNGAPTMDFVLGKVLEIFQRPTSAAQAADDALAFLDPLDDGKVVEQLAQLGETGLMALFQAQPILKPATSNTPRLVEFIRAFLKMHAEDVQAAAIESQKAAPPLTN